ncbi:hypothetical protein [Shimia sagamensis]|uniref:Prokaryotic phospholipase A2 n=1 Tax=Shimia sagamensis TaxID=1566352 RepID=A0ABY1PDM2_9RHOB|nr:hypothetical protein [Shimia sagamensis]SMP31874.1 hypothetical protein SAMN06265373_10891 [Shimia sagamensis]
MTFSEAFAVLFLVSVLTDPAAAQNSDDGPGWSAKVEIWRHSRLQALRETDPAALVPFTTDGCSGGMSAAWGAMAKTFPWFAQVFAHEAPWHDCCVVHDQAYHLGGEDPVPEAGFRARLEADEALRQCVQGVADSEADVLAQQYDSTPDDVAAAVYFVSERMYDAVRVGGLPCSGLPWRWGYGWPQCF